MPGREDSRRDGPPASTSFALQRTPSPLHTSRMEDHGHRAVLPAPEATEVAPQCYFDGDDHSGTCEIFCRNERFARGLDDSEITLVHTVRVICSKMTDEVDGANQYGYSRGTRKSATEPPSTSRTVGEEIVSPDGNPAPVCLTPSGRVVFIGIVVGDPNINSKKAIKMEIGGDTMMKNGQTVAAQDHMKSLISSGHKLSVQLDWTRPEFDREEALWSFVARGYFMCTECPADPERLD
ncbi:hypothetical protein BJ508DRAFT_316277 [Ascobolus immersus RN42]|uniref:Uncharacterized protein n=1 Tax=Ascobolus immersus RN42 TaxID=1160509 RepID=A0A3N4H769_ASCIM|nr:hypothetical protein BJ508DRAFT_316277 [Ascobolus immersus RN42]